MYRITNLTGVAQSITEHNGKARNIEPGKYFDTAHVTRAIEEAQAAGRLGIADINDQTNLQADVARDLVDITFNGGAGNLPIQFKSNNSNLGGVDVNAVNFGTGLNATRSGSQVNITAATNLQLKNAGSNLGNASPASINFTGAGVTASRTGDEITVNVAGSSGSSAPSTQYKSSGTNLGAADVTSVNFTGAGLTATRTGDEITVNVAAVSGGSAPATQYKNANTNLGAADATSVNFTGNITASRTGDEITVNVPTPAAAQAPVQFKNGSTNLGATTVTSVATDATITATRTANEVVLSVPNSTVDNRVNALKGVANGIAGLNAQGNLNANIVPRTNTLSNLLTVSGANGELSVATDEPTIVKHNGVANQAVPINAHGWRQVNLARGQTGLVIPTNTENITVAVTGSGAVPTATLQNATRNGQLLNVYFANDGDKVAAFGDLSSFPGAIIAKYVSAGTAWRLYEVTPLQEEIGGRPWIVTNRLATLGDEELPSDWRDNSVVFGKATGVYVAEDSGYVARGGTVCIGTDAVAHLDSVVIGGSVSSKFPGSIVMGSRVWDVTVGSFTHPISDGSFGVQGKFALAGETYDATPVRLVADGFGSPSDPGQCPMLTEGGVFNVRADIIAYDINGDKVAKLKREFIAYRSLTGTITIKNLQTIGTDFTDGLGTLTVAVTPDQANETFAVTVGGSTSPNLVKWVMTADFEQML